MARIEREGRKERREGEANGQTFDMTAKERRKGMKGGREGRKEGGRYR